MSLKNPTPTARLRPRLIGASALAAAFMLTAPYTFADPEEKLAGGNVKTHSIMKIEMDDNGEKTKKTIEITKDGDEIIAWETNELTGERRRLEDTELSNMDIHVTENDGRVMTFHSMDDDDNGTKTRVKKRVMIMGGDNVLSHDVKDHMDGDKNVFVMKMHNDGQSHSRIATEAKIAAAMSLLSDEMEGEVVSEDVRRSLRKAHKALEKAQRKLDAEK